MRKEGVQDCASSEVVRFWLGAGTLFAALVIVYSNSFHNEFHFDDFHTITDNPAVRSLQNVPRFFVDANTFSVLPANRTYRPLVSTSLALDYAIGHGYVPFWFHVSTFAWFVVLLGCLYLFYEAMLRRAGAGSASRYLALVSAAWFGLHPATAETVNYIIQRGDLYCTLGCVAALVWYERFPAQRRYGCYLLPLAGALLSKPPGAVFPLLLMFYVLFFHVAGSDQRWRAAVSAAAPSLAMTGGLMWLQASMTPKSFTPTAIPAWSYRLTQPYVWLRYFAELFAPLHLNVDSDLQPLTTVDWRALAGIAFALAIAAAIWFASRQRRFFLLAYGLIWFLLTQLPTSVYPLAEVENDHRMFFSFAGLAPAVVWTVWRLLHSSLSEYRLRRLQPALVGCMVVLLSGYAWGTHVRNRVWRTEESLWLDDVHKSPRNGRGLMIYGLTQMSKGLYPEALAYFMRALEFTPDYPTLEINLGVVNGAMARNAEAEAHFRRAVALASADDLGHAFYGRWLLEQNRIGEAVSEERAAVSLNPLRPMQRDLLLLALQRTGDGEALREAAAQTAAVMPGDAVAQGILAGDKSSDLTAMINLSFEQYRRGEYAASLASARRALVIDPHSALAYNNAGAAYGALNELDKAIESAKQALQLDPSLELAKNNLALFTADRLRRQSVRRPSAADLVNRSMSLHQSGKFAESIVAARAALRLDARSAESWNNIAADYAAMKRWDRAIEAAHRAIELKRDFPLAQNNLAWAESQKAAGK